MTQARPRTGGDGQGDRAPARGAVTQRQPAGEASREGDRISGMRHDLGIDMDAVRQSGLEVVGAVPWGTHFCQFYQTRRDLVETLVPYFREGLAANEFCMWITSPPLQVEEAKAVLRAAVPNLDDYIASGQIEILDYSDWYVRDGEFRPDDVLQGWVDKHDDARRRGYDGLRLTGNTFWLEPNSWGGFTQYEEKVDSVIGQYRMLAICTYSLEKCGAGEIADVIANHEFALVKRSGGWQIIESARHRLTEAALRESEERFRRLAEAALEGILIHDESRVLDVNEAFAVMFGYQRSELIGMDRTVLVPPEWLARVLQKIDSGSEGSYEAMGLKKDGTAFPVEVCGKAVPYEGRVVRVAAVRDLTERKQAEEALRESERHYRLLAENVTDLIWTTDLKLRPTYASPSILRLLGYTVEEAMALKLKDILAPESLDVVKKVYAEEIGGGNLQEIDPHRSRALEMQVYRRDGALMWVEANVTLLRDADGRPAGLLGVSRDVTERKRMEEALRESERHYRLLAENVTDVIWTSDLDLRLTYISPSIQQVSGFTVEECMAQARLGTLTSESLERVKRVHADTLAIELGQRPLTGSRTVEAEARRKDGSTAWIEAKVSFLRDSDGTPIGILGVSRDITERKRAEQALRRRTHDLGERLKELQCLYALSRLVQKRGISVDEIASGAVALLPPAWQYPETASARIVLEGREVMTENFRGTRWRQSCDILVHGERSGIVEVCYLDERPHSDEGPFLKEERDLIKAIAEILGRVVEGKQAEEALRASEANYRAIFSSASDAIVVYDAETASMVDVNPRFCQIFGYTPEEARQLRLEDLGSGEPPYTEEEAVQWVKEAAELEIGPFEFRAKDKAGGPVWVEGSLRLVVIEGREYLLGIGHDIGERKRAEEALQETREELESRVERGMQRGNPYGLTFRELTVLHLVAAGKADKEIAVELGISPQTASKHLANILSKMGAASRTEAGVRALREGLLE